MKAQFPTEQTESGEFQRQEDAVREWIDRVWVNSLAAVLKINADRVICSGRCSHLKF